MTNKPNKYGAMIPENNEVQTTPNYRDYQRAYEAPSERNFIKEEFDRLKLGEPARASVNSTNARIDELYKAMKEQLAPTFEEINRRLEELEYRVAKLSIWIKPDPKDITENKS